MSDVLLPQEGCADPGTSITNTAGLQTPAGSSRGHHQTTAVATPWGCVTATTVMQNHHHFHPTATAAITTILLPPSHCSHLNATAVLCSQYLSNL